MIKKTEHHTQQFIDTIDEKKVIIFDLCGVLLFKKKSQDLMANPQATSSMHVINFIESLHLLRLCKTAGHKLFVLSNMSIAELERIKKEPEIASLFSFFDDIIISSMTPYKKPAPEIFTYFCEQYKVQPKDCIFIDDKQENLDGAIQAGISQTILCSNFDITQVHQELIIQGVLHYHNHATYKTPTGQA